VSDSWLCWSAKLMKAGVVEGYHDMLAFFASSKVETLPPADRMSVTLVQPSRREVRWTGMDPVNG